MNLARRLIGGELLVWERQLLYTCIDGGLLTADRFGRRLVTTHTARKPNPRR